MGHKCGNWVAETLRRNQIHIRSIIVAGNKHYIAIVISRDSRCQKTIHRGTGNINHRMNHWVAFKDHKSRISLHDSPSCCAYTLLPLHLLGTSTAVSLKLDYVERDVCGCAKTLFLQNLLGTATVASLISEGLDLFRAG